MTIETQKLRDLICRALPLPYVLATSNSWRRILSRDGAAVCSPCNQADGHVDLHFPGGDESATAKLLIEAPNALPGLLDHIDAQAAEMDGLRAELEHHKAYIIHRQGQLLYCTSAMRDAYADEKVRADAAEAEIARLRQALQRIADWCPPTVVSRGERVPMSVAVGSNGERDHFRDLSRAALSGESND